MQLQVRAAANKAEVDGRVPPRIAEWCDEFRECLGCQRVYRSGSHYRVDAALGRATLLSHNRRNSDPSQPETGYVWRELPRQQFQAPAQLRGGQVGFPTSHPGPAHPSRR